MKTLLITALLVISTMAIMPKASAAEQLLCGNDGIIRLAEDPSINMSWAGNCRYTTPLLNTYTFSLQNPPFNYTAEWPANDTISNVVINAGWKNEESFDITETSEYSILYEYNSGETLDFHFRYEKHGWGVFGYWKTVYTFLYNGNQFCNYEESEYNGRNRISTHTMVRIFAGAEADASSGAGINSYDEIANMTAPTHMEYRYSDYTTPLSTSRATGIAYYFGDSVTSSTPCFYEEANVTLPFTHLSAPISITFTTNEDEVRPIFIGAQIGNRTQNLQLVRNALDGFESFVAGLEESNVFCQGGFFAFTFCFATTTITGLIGWVFSLVGTIVSAMFSIFPYGKELYEILTYPVDVSFDIFLLLVDIYLTPGEGYGPGGTYLSLWVWSACFGCGIAAITGNLRYAWVMPIGFLKYSTIGVAYAAYFIYYKIPKEGLTILMDGIKIARGG